MLQLATLLGFVGLLSLGLAFGMRALAWRWRQRLDLAHDDPDYCRHRLLQATEWGARLFLVGLPALGGAAALACLIWAGSPSTPSAGGSAALSSEHVRAIVQEMLPLVRPAWLPPPPADTPTAWINRLEIPFVIALAIMGAVILFFLWRPRPAPQPGQPPEISTPKKAAASAVVTFLTILPVVVEVVLALRGPDATDVEVRLPEIRMPEIRVRLDRGQLEPHFRVIHAQEPIGPFVAAQAKEFEGAVPNFCHIIGMLADAGAEVVFVVGSHDRRKLDDEADEHWGGNTGLAQARAEYVQSKFYECRAAEGLAILPMIGGPTHESVSEYHNDRVVRVTGLVPELEVNESEEIVQVIAPLPAVAARPRVHDKD